jgi:hypothetical protein
LVTLVTVVTGGPEMAAIGRQKEAMLITALAAGKSQVEAARLAGVAERTVRRRVQDPVFCREVRECRARVLETAVGELTATVNKAVRKLGQLLDSQSENISLGAARCVLQEVVHLRESLDMEERISVLEDRLETQVGGFGCAR